MSEASSATRRQVVEGSTLGAGILLMLALFAIVNYFGWKYHARFDWTANHIYTLSEKSQKVLADLDRDIDVVVFVTPENQLFDQIRELLARYDAASSHLHVRYIDPAKDLAEAQSLANKYKINQLNVVVFDRGDDRRVVETNDLAEYDYSGMQMGQAPELTGFKGEQKFTSTILELMESRKPKILFTTGHGEARLDDGSAAGLSQAEDLLGRDNFDLDEWASLGKQSVPDGTDLVVVAGPTSGFVEPELAVLKRYLDGGGRLLVLLDPTLDANGPPGHLVATGLGSWLATYGVHVGDDIVVDPSNPLPFFGPETIFLSSYGDHPIVQPLSQAQVPVIFALARSVATGEKVGGLDAVELLKTSSAGWGETDLVNLRSVAKGADDVAGPVPLGVAVSTVTEKGAAASDEETPGEEGEATADPPDDPAPPAGAADTSGATPGQAAEPAASTSKPGLRLVVYGDSDFAENGQLANVGNATLLANTVNWLVERENLVTIPPKKPEQVRLNLTRSQHATIGWLVLAMLPGLAIVTGIAVYWRRRR